MQPFAISIDGMHCGGCVDRVTTALKSIPGVALESVKVGSASGQFDENATTTNTMVQALEKMGFDARPVAPSPASSGGCGGGSCNCG